MKCDVCGEEIVCGSDGARIVVNVSTHEDGGVHHLRVAVCPACRYRILQDTTHESLAAAAKSLLLGSFRDTVAGD